MTFFDEITGFFRGLFGDGAVGYVLDENTLVFVIFGMLLALISAFFGFKTFKFWCAFVGFVAFYVLGMMLAGLFLPAGWPQIVMALVCALVGAVLAFMLVKAGVFIVCAGLTFGIVYALTSLWPVAGVVAIIIGVLSWWVSDYIVMVVTSVAGGFMLGGGISYFLPAMAPVLVVIVSIALAAAGFIVQMAMYRRSERYKATKAVKKKDEPVKAAAAPAQAGGDKSADHKDA